MENSTNGNINYDSIIRKLQSKIYGGEYQYKVPDEHKSNWEEIKTAIITPTVDEVCKALNKYAPHKDVSYNQDKKQFYACSVMGNSFTICYLMENGKIFVCRDIYLKPQDFSLVGRFFEGE